MANHASSLPAPVAGLDAVYLRPEPLDAAHIDRVLHDIRDWGARTVFLEAGYDNRVLYQGGPFPAFSDDVDWLRIISSRARRLGLGVHVWVKACFWGHGRAAYEGVPLFRDHADWLDCNRAGEVLVAEGGTHEERDYLFVHPGHEGVRRSLTALVERLYAYDIDGISLDYIRFKACEPDPARWFGFNPSAVARFQAETGIDPRRLDADTTPGSPFLTWVAWNESQVHGLVAAVKQRMVKLNRTTGRNLRLSASPFTGYQSGLNSKCQNWKTWDADHLIDVWLPMCMSVGLAELEAEVRGIAGMGLKAPWLPVLYPNQHGSLHPPLRDQLPVLARAGALRFAAFEYRQLKAELG